MNKLLLPMGHVPVTKMPYHLPQEREGDEKQESLQ